MIHKTRNLMKVLKQLSDTYESYDAGSLNYLDTEERAKRILDHLDACLADGEVRHALEILYGRSGETTISNIEADEFLSIEIRITDGFGFTRNDLRDLVRHAAERGKTDKGPLPDQHPADLLMSSLRFLHTKQMNSLEAAKKLGRRKKKEAKTGLRKGLAKVTGGVAVMVADSTLLPAAAPASLVAGYLAMVAGIDDLGG